MIKNIRGQSILEYVIIIVVVVVAVIALNIYMKRGVEGKLRDSTDQIGQQFDIANTTTDITRGRSGTSLQTIKDGVTTSATTGAGEEHTEHGAEINMFNSSEYIRWLNLSRASSIGIPILISFKSSLNS